MHPRHDSRREEVSRRACSRSCACPSATRGAAKPPRRTSARSRRRKRFAWLCEGRRSAAVSRPGGDPSAKPKRGPKGYAFPTTADRLLAWRDVELRLVKARRYWLASTNDDGTPHVRPLWGVWVGGNLYFDGHPKTRWARNLARDPRASVHLESAAHVVIVEGLVEDLERTDADLGESQRRGPRSTGDSFPIQPVTASSGSSRIARAAGARTSRMEPSGRSRDRHGGHATPGPGSRRRAASTTRP